MARMTRRSNPTGLYEIPRTRIELTASEGGGEKRFALTKLDLADRNLPEGAVVICVARAGRTTHRFELGPVGHWNRSPRAIPQAGSDPVTFRVLVREGRSPKLLATAENLRLREPGQAQSLIPIETTDLGQLAWRLDCSSESGPVLQVNIAVYPSAAIAENDAQFVALVLPEVMAQVCHKIALDPDALDDETDWRFLWKQWLTEIGSPLPETEAEDKVEEWVADVVERFCNKHMFCLTLQRQNLTAMGVS